jgi:phosphoenolpyruvate phosphomutase
MMEEQAKSLKNLLKGSKIIRIAGAHNALGSKLVERAGFDGVWSSGLEISASHGVPDADILTMTEFLAAAQSMANVVRIPVIADCDSGYGNSNNVIHMVQKFEAAGVAAVCIEDKQFPKMNSFIPGRQELAPIAEFVGKIMAAKNAQRTEDFLVIARVEALIAGLDQDEALRRAHAYAEAGADAILIHDKSISPQSIIDFARAWDFNVPLVVVPTTYYSITTAELEALGIKVVIYANHGLRASIKAVSDTFTEILQAGSTAGVEDRIAPMNLVFELQGFPQLQRDEQAYLRSGSKLVRTIIPAAGDHLNEYSMKHIAEDIPMAMLDVNGKSLVRRQLEVLNSSGIHDVVVVGGYKHEKIREDGIKLVVNSEWRTNGEVESILCADDRFTGHILIVYSDILFDREVLELLLKSEHDITLLVDNTYDARRYTGNRRLDLVQMWTRRRDAQRSLGEYHQNRVVKIGKNLPCSYANGEFAGLALLSHKGFSQLRQAYKKALLDRGDRPFHEAKSVVQASLTDLFQELIDNDIEVQCVETSSGWMEIHSFDDYRSVYQVVGR